MNIILSIICVCFFILLIFNFCQYRALNIELSYLPNIEANVEQLEHSLMGEDIRTIMPHNWNIPSKRLIIQVSLTSCSSCHVALEQLLKNKNKYKAEYYVMSVASGNRDEEKNKIKEFIYQYKDSVKTLPYSKEFLDRADISQYPTFIFINHDGKIEMVTSLAGKLHSFLTK
ncbi:hypothetical protein ICR95_25600 (plasmid) [Priestia megaterium]|uniref:TlpA family protein disulfide reductase n=1 Tax=Priestia megaterium TaxID=1404 RepID=UPI00196B4D4B|nr:hypothetical protein [Priestia megaterium]QSF35852.1 hypothetical protein ICR95_25600 [Priestia megaterium]